MSIQAGTVVKFKEIMTNRQLEGTVIECGGGLVKIATPDGRTHSRVPSRVVPLQAGMTLTDIKDRFKYLRQVVTMVANSDAVSAIISGPGGVGKTHTVTKTLATLGFVEGRDYHLVKGFTSARALYETLHDNNGLLTVFDDCDSALENNISASILKGALDTLLVRRINWLVKTNVKNSQYPLGFDYDGRIIFVTNKLIDELDGPLRTRSMIVKFKMTRAEILDWMEYALPDFNGYSMAEKKIAMAFIRRLSPDVRELSLRTLLMVLKIMKAHPADWTDLAAHIITR
ncbi:MAG: hypothetical protein WCS94_25410 [Verrucomicrobiota bacterium]